ncbi:MAG: hypothetical protein OXF63_12720 [Anaerolineaceae bacterium]|nr:hypothetical protein [Anaerolineaceae bacterium]
MPHLEVDQPLGNPQIEDCIVGEERVVDGVDVGQLVTLGINLMVNGIAFHHVGVFDGMVGAPPRADDGQLRVEEEEGDGASKIAGAAKQFNPVFHAVGFDGRINPALVAGVLRHVLTQVVARCGPGRPARHPHGVLGDNDGQQRYWLGEPHGPGELVKDLQLHQCAAGSQLLLRRGQFTREHFVVPELNIAVV